MMMRTARFWVWVAVFSLLLSGSIAHAGAKGQASSSSKSGGKAVVKGSSKPQKGKAAGRSVRYSQRASKEKSSPVQNSFNERLIR
ncbi:MAG: hypothetical protein ACYDIC_16585 [Desulfobaccales bacterium]